MMNTLCLTNEQARQIANGERVEVWVPHDKPLGKPYCDETEAHQYNKAGTAWFFFAGSDANTIRVIRAPFLAGDEVGVREAWMCLDPNFRLPAKDSYAEVQVDGVWRWVTWKACGMHAEWGPAETMPEWAMRSRPTCTSCRPEKRDQWGWLVTLEPTKTGAH
jgi:hypothetical protein